MKIEKTREILSVVRDNKVGANPNFRQAQGIWNKIWVKSW